MEPAQALNSMNSQLAESFQQIERDKDQLQTILSGMIEGVIAFDNEQTILFVNHRAAQLLDLAHPGQVVGKKLAVIGVPEAMLILAVKTLANHGPYRSEVDLEPAPRSLNVYVSRLPEPNSSGAVMVLNDTTELKRLERLRQDFVANVSHELKTPLANIKSSVEVLLDGAADDVESRTMFLHQIDEQAVRLEALVIDLLSIAQLESGATHFTMNAVVVDDAVDACLDRHRTRGETKKLLLSAVAVGDSASKIAVWCDDDALAQILDNLVDNAIKYTPHQGRVTVRWRLDADQVCIEVENEGAGIPEEKLPRIFERFYRVDKARSREMGGTGLGLSIVKHMTQAMQGSVSVTSKLNVGTTFSVCLPQAAHE